MNLKERLWIIVGCCYEWLFLGMAILGLIAFVVLLGSCIYRDIIFYR